MLDNYLQFRPAGAVCDYMHVHSAKHYCWGQSNLPAAACVGTRVCSTYLVPTYLPICKNAWFIVAEVVVGNFVH